MKDDLSGSSDVDFFATKLKNNINFDFSIASTFLNTVTKDNLVDSEISWKNINKKNINMLVLEVLKRKELLIENNTSRDLTFSENKRNAWNDVRTLLMSKFPHFDLNVEAIKSHWRYRKRKVTDVYQDFKCANFDNKVQNKLSPIDFFIFKMLKESNILEKNNSKNNFTTTSPSEGEDFLSENFSPDQNTILSVSPFSSAFIQQQHSNFQQRLNEITQNSTQNFFSNSNESNISNSNSNSILKSFNDTNIMERIAAFLFIQQEQKNLQQQQFLLDKLNTSSSIYTSQSQSSYLSTPSLIEMHPNNDAENNINNNSIINDKLNNNNFKTIHSNIVDLKSLNLCKNYINQDTTKDSQNEDKCVNSIVKSISSTMEAVVSIASSITSMPINNLNKRKRRTNNNYSFILDKKRCSQPNLVTESTPQLLNRMKNSTSTQSSFISFNNKNLDFNNCESIETYQKMAFIAQRDAYLNLQAVISDVKAIILPQILATLQDLNKYQLIQKLNFSTAYNIDNANLNNSKSPVLIADNELYKTEFYNNDTTSDCHSAKSTEMRCDDDENDVENVDDDNHFNIDVDNQNSDNDNNLLNRYNNTQKSSLLYNNMFLKINKNPIDFSTCKNSKNLCTDKIS